MGGVNSRYEPVAAGDGVRGQARSGFGAPMQPGGRPVAPLAGDPGVRVACPNCHSVLVPPASVFRCPCGQIMTFAASSSSDGRASGGSASATSAASAGPGGGSPAVPGRQPPQPPHGPYGPGTLPMSVMQQASHLPPGTYMLSPGMQGGAGGGGAGGGGVPGGVVFTRVSGPRMQPNDVEDRIRNLLVRIPPSDPHAVFLRALLERLPRRADGSVDATALEQIARQVDQSLKGAPQSVIDLLPVRKFTCSQLPAESERQAEHTSCMVCLSDFEEGQELRTLPCLHAFHSECVDRWLAGNKQCPICRVPIDIDANAAVLALEAEEANPSKRSNGGGNGGSGGSGGSGSGGSGGSASGGAGSAGSRADNRSAFAPSAW